jgi:uncharacterized membrane protein YeaQ/YmgE (transglycosylase-associated protein family)
MIGLIIALIISGAIVGGLARLVVPGPDPMGFWATVAMGILGQLIAGVIVGAIFNRAAGFVVGLLVTVGLVLVSRRTGIGRRDHVLR